MDAPIEPRDLVGLLEPRLPAFEETLREIVNIDSGTFSPDGVNQVASVCERLFRTGGWTVERRRHEPSDEEPPLGDILVGRLEGRSWPRILLLGHMDTVFPDGTAAARPFRVEDDRAFGPGVSDMKGGLLAGFLAVDVLLHQGWDPSITFICNPDEEIGSPFSKPVIQEIAADADACFVLEAGRENGNIVSARKGMATFVVETAGKAAHAGVEPDRGRSAILEVSHKVMALHSLNGRWEGVTVNVGVISGGTRPNVVPEHCVLEADLRATDETSFDAALEEVTRVATAVTVEGTSAKVRVLEAHRPMVKGPATERLVALVQEISLQLGSEVQDQATGGASDGNTTSAMGVPTLDGLGPVGGGPHGPHEWLDRSSVVPRVAMLACLLARTREALPQP